VRHVGEGGGEGGNQNRLSACATRGKKLLKEGGESGSGVQKKSFPPLQERKSVAVLSEAKKPSKREGKPKRGSSVSEAREKKSVSGTGPHSNQESCFLLSRGRRVEPHIPEGKKKRAAKRREPPTPRKTTKNSLHPYPTTYVGKGEHTPTIHSRRKKKNQPEAKPRTGGKDMREEGGKREKRSFSFSNKRKMQSPQRKRNIPVHVLSGKGKRNKRDWNPPNLLERKSAIRRTSNRFWKKRGKSIEPRLTEKKEKRCFRLPHTWWGQTHRSRKGGKGWIRSYLTPGEKPPPPPGKKRRRTRQKKKKKKKKSHPKKKPRPRDATTEESLSTLPFPTGRTKKERGEPVCSSTKGEKKGETVHRPF